MNSERITKTLEELCSVITDGSHRSPKSTEFGKPMASVKDLTRNGINYESSRKISLEEFDSLKKSGCCPKIGDVLIAKDGNSALETVCVHNDEREVCLLSSVAIFRTGEGLDPFYLRYFLESPKTKYLLKGGYISGSAIPRVVLKDFKVLPISLPSKSEQKAIAHILRTLDEKIELNKKNNETLEGIAKALFKSWFLDFDPVRAKVERRLTGLPDEISDLFPDSFEDSELGKIPKDWKKVSISQFVDIKSSKRVKMSEYKNQGVPFYRSKEIIQKASKQSINTEIFISNSQYESFRQKHGAPVEGDILLTSVGTLGIPYLVREIDGKFYFKDGNLTWFTNFSKNLDSKYLFYFLQSKEGKGRINEISIGSTQAALTIEGLKSITITLPPLSIMRIFSEIINSLFQKISINLQDTSALEKIRDSILPKLMTGELKIPDAEKIIEEVGI